jgi:hypothetical protein
MIPDDFEGAFFLNVDIDVESDNSADIECIAAAVSDFAIILNKTGVFLSFELDRAELSIEPLLRHVVSMISRFNSPQRDCWDRCLARRANIGISAGRDSNQTTFRIDKYTVAALASVDLDLEWTIYPANASL